MFAFYNRHNNNLYNKLVELSRNIFFYKDLKLSDNFETRIMLIFFHFSVILLKFKKNNNSKFPQKIFDNIFLNIEYHLRELGHGDVVVNKKMKTLNKIFYNILLKMEINNDNKLVFKKNIINEHFILNDNNNSKIVSKLEEYYGNFCNFCFELEDEIMLKGQIDYKY
tara:strand:+ start:231 stop:731 length:501 start_codon:yes stop_codon:yes gene_type:complete